MSEIHALFIICFIAVLAPLLARLPALIRTPVVVLELVLGILIGLSGAGWVTSQGAIGFLGEFGLIFLFFQAGFEFNQDKIGVAPLRLGALAWLVSLGLTSVFVELLYIVGCCARLCSSRLCYQRHHSASSFLFSAKPATSISSIHDRPKDVEARADIGHWEGDLIICKRTRPVLVLHECKSRMTLAARLTGKTAAETISVMLAVFGRINPALRKSITFDNDTAFAQHALLRAMRDMATWFCDAYASWQKGERGFEQRDTKLQFLGFYLGTKKRPNRKRSQLRAGEPAPELRLSAYRWPGPSGAQTAPPQDR
jgi:hypothetical protein